MIDDWVFFLLSFSVAMVILRDYWHGFYHFYGVVLQWFAVTQIREIDGQPKQTNMHGEILQ